MRDRHMQVGRPEDDGAIAGKAPCLDREVSLIVMYSENDVVSTFDALPEHGVRTYWPFNIDAFCPRPRDAGRDGFAIFISHRVRVETCDNNLRTGDPPSSARRPLSAARQAPRDRG